MKTTMPHSKQPSSLLTSMKKKDSSIRCIHRGVTTLTKIVVLTSIVSSSHALQTNFNRKLPVGLKPVTRSLLPNPYYERRRKQVHSLSVGAAALFGADGPSSELSNDTQVVSSWMESSHVGVASDQESDRISLKDKLYLTLFGGFAIAGLFGLLGMSTTEGCWRYFLAGGVCAAVSHAIPTPIDVVKTRKQIDPELADVHVLQATRMLVKKEGMSILWSGLGPTVFGYLFEGAVKFGVYEVLKPIIKSVLSSLSAATSLGFFNSRLLAFMLSGAASGLAASFMLCPMEALRIRMVAEPDFAPNGFVEGGRKILQREGIAGLGKGLSPMVLKQVPYTITKNVSFDIFTTALYAMLRAQSMTMTAGVKFTVPFVSAVVASILSCISSQPGDMVLSLVNAHEGEERPGDIFKRILKGEKGIGGFFVGFKTRMVHVGVIVTLQLLIYDYVKRLCGIAATGCA